MEQGRLSKSIQRKAGHLESLFVHEECRVRVAGDNLSPRGSFWEGSGHGATVHARGGQNRGP